MQSKITKAIIPVAGIGSRFLPASKSIPKEMFPLVNKPVIHYIVESAVEAGIKDVIFVLSSSKKCIGDYFNYNFELDFRLAKKGKNDLKNKIRKLHRMANFYFLLQPEPLGDGDAVLRASKLLCDGEPALVMWGDDVIVSRKNQVKELIKIYNKYNSPVFLVEEIKGKDIEKYGVIKGKRVDKDLYKVSYIVEKPKMKDAPSNLGIVGNYILTKEVVESLKNQTAAKDGEIRFSHALRDSMSKCSVYAYKFKGVRFDCGNKLGWVKANVYFGLKDKEIKNSLLKFIQEMV